MHCGMPTKSFQDTRSRAVDVSDVPPCETTKPVVVYILGPGRSGSTVLGIALGNIKSVFFAGELGSWTQFRGTPLVGSSERFGYWKRIRDRITDSSEYFEYEFHRLLDHHSALLRPWRFFNRSLLTNYARQNTDLFRAIRAESGSKFIVDSSHYPLRLLQLRRIEDIDVRTIYLVRDPRAIIHSLGKPVQRRVPMNYLVANIYCNVVLLLSTVAYLRCPRRKRIRVRFEEFIDNPRETMERLVAFLGIDETVVSLDCLRMDCLRTGNIFHSNRVGEQDSIAIRLPEPDDGLRGVWYFITTILQLPFMLLHGYLRPRRGR